MTFYDSILIAVTAAGVKPLFFFKVFFFFRISLNDLRLIEGSVSYGDHPARKLCNKY